MLELQNVSYKYKNGGESVFENLNYKFEGNRFYAITGKSGSGKTTLLSLLGGLDVPNSGEILYNGKNIKDIGYSKYRRDIVSLVFQSYNLIDYMTPFENLQLVNKNANRDILLEMGLDISMADRNVMKLSGGQQQRVAIARAISQNTDIILLDEPTGNLDKKTEREIISIIKELAKERLVILVTHSMYVAKQADVTFEFSKMI